MRRLTIVSALAAVTAIGVGVGVTRASQDQPDRTIVRGKLVKFNGLGPERWARRYRIEHRRWQLERAHRRRLNRALERRVVRHTQAHVDASSGHLAAWLCIHRYEGAWDSDTGNGYYGGLQMDLDFQRAYGSELLAAKGTANNWTPGEQMAVAERAYQRGRGFSPWLNTARMCGLL